MKLHCILDVAKLLYSLRPGFDSHQIELHLALEGILGEIGLRCLG